MSWGEIPENHRHIWRPCDCMCDDVQCVICGISRPDVSAESRSSSLREPEYLICPITTLALTQVRLAEDGESTNV